MNICDVARELGISPDSIKRWEQAGKIPPARRTLGGWRIYDKEDMETIKRKLPKERNLIKA